jgi:RHS repeat-associated protein
VDGRPADGTNAKVVEAARRLTHICQNRADVGHRRIPVIENAGHQPTRDITSQVTWSSSNTGVATIDSSGLASGASQGTSVISASLGSINSSVTITVNVAAPSVHYYFLDHLGSTAVITNATGTVIEQESDYYPYGRERVIVGGTSNYTFTGKERDSETGLDYFGARYFGSNMGRLMSPDPGNIAAVFHPDDPQAWNGYAYARNNPLLYSDPDGMSYRVCDSEGKNCYNFENNADYQNWLKNNNQVERGGWIYQKNPDGSQTRLGTVEYYDGPTYAMLASVDRMAGPLVRALAWTTMAFVGGMTAVEMAGLAGPVIDQPGLSERPPNF